MPLLPRRLPQRHESRCHDANGSRQHEGERAQHLQIGELGRSGKLQAAHFSRSVETSAGRQNGWAQKQPTTADHGRLSRSRALRHLPVRPRSAPIVCSLARPVRLRGHAPGSRCPSRSASRRRHPSTPAARFLFLRTPSATPALDQTHVSRRAGPAPDLRRVRRVGRGRLRKVATEIVTQSIALSRSSR